jgi:ornithine carrier protein
MDTMSDAKVTLKGDVQDEVPAILMSSQGKASARAKEAAQEVIFGSLAGIVGKVVEYPFDTVKVRLQSQPTTFPLTYTGPLDCFKQSIQREGVRGLYRGISAPLFGAAVETSSLFFSVSFLTARRYVSTN